MYNSVGQKNEKKDDVSSGPHVDRLSCFRVIGAGITPLLTGAAAGAFGFFSSAACGATYIAKMCVTGFSAAGGTVGGGYVADKVCCDPRPSR